MASRALGCGGCRWRCSRVCGLAHAQNKQACEDGIPLEYLAGLDKCYRNFMEEMETTVAACLNVKWDTFGDAR